MDSAIITGATSFIGAGVVRYLVDAGVKCYAIVRPGSRNLAALPYENERLIVVRGDAAEPERWKKMLPACDAFFHFAWDGVGAKGRSDTEIQDKNVRMALDCFRTAAAIGCKRFIFSGSQAEYGICDGVITEQTSCNPVIEYGRGKLEVLRQAKMLSSELGVTYVHLRIFSVYGPGDHPWTLVSRCVETFRKNGQMDLSPCTQMWNYLYLDDAAEIIARFGECVLKEDDPVYNVAGEETKPLREYVEIIRAVCGGGIPNYGTLGKTDEPLHGIWPDIHRMVEVTSWKTKTSFSQGIQRILATEE